MTYVLSHTNEYQKAEDSRKELGIIVGAGVLVAEGIWALYS